MGAVHLVARLRRRISRRPFSAIIDLPQEEQTVSGPFGPLALCIPLRPLSGRPHEAHFHSLLPLDPGRLAVASSALGCTSSGTEILSSFGIRRSDSLLDGRTGPLGVSSRFGAGVAVFTRDRLSREAGDGGGKVSNLSS
jgi:hypothetical protein